MLFPPAMMMWIYLAVYALITLVFLVCTVIATVSLVRIARRLGEMAGTFADVKRELEEVKGKLG